MRDFDYFSDDARPRSAAGAEAGGMEGLEEQLLAFRQRRNSYARQLVMALATLAAAVWFVSGYGELIRYTLATAAEPVELGDVAKITPDALPHNAYVSLSGITEHRGMTQKVVRGWDVTREEYWYFRLAGSRGVFIEVRPDPEQYGLATAVRVRGRVVDPRRESKYAPLLDLYHDKFFAEVRPDLRIIQVGVLPGEGKGTLFAGLGILAALAALNVWTIVRMVRLQRQRPVIPAGRL